MRSQPVPVTRLPWAELPAEVFAELRHLAEPVYLDTSGNLPRDSSPPYSILAFEPEEVVSGALTSERDLASFESLLARDAISPTDVSFPLGGWFGTVDYDGSYRFGLYRNLLIYDHFANAWWEVGGGELSARRQVASASPSPVFGEWEANFTAAEFAVAVAVAKRYIAAGDVYQINLSQRFAATCTGESLWPCYSQLREISPAPMAAYLCTDTREILSSSPELFLKFSQNRVETRPIKGTRPRFDDSEADIRSSNELKTSEKEHAELLMITDLLRNDLGRVCEFGSVEVSALARLESLAQVHHLVSTVTGTLRGGVSHLAALASCCPGGSITGAPKKRATEIIAELESTPRGLYTGIIGYLGLNGESQFSIAIRTLIREGAQAHYHVGSGIVADSVPELEYEETLHKARGLRAVVSPEG